MCKLHSEAKLKRRKNINDMGKWNKNKLWNYLFERELSWAREGNKKNIVKCTFLNLPISFKFPADIVWLVTSLTFDVDFEIDQVCIEISFFAFDFDIQIIAGVYSTSWWWEAKATSEMNPKYIKIQFNLFGNKRKSSEKALKFQRCQLFISTHSKTDYDRF